jgi:hypothetical protein
MSATGERERAILAAKTDFPTALQRARGVSDAWYRAQALAWVARFAPEAEVERVAREALEAAGAGKDAYQQVASSAWAIRALAERGRSKKAAEAVPSLLRLSGEISPPVSRLTALFLLWQSVGPLERTVRLRVLNSLVSACLATVGWQGGHTLREVVRMLASEDPGEAQRILAQMPEGKYKRQAQRQLEEGQTLAPRSFFW